MNSHVNIRSYNTWSDQDYRNFTSSMAKLSGIESFLKQIEEFKQPVNPFLVREAIRSYSFSTDHFNRLLNWVDSTKGCSSEAMLSNALEVGCEQPRIKSIIERLKPSVTAENISTALRQGYHSEIISLLSKGSSTSLLAQGIRLRCSQKTSAEMFTTYTPLLEQLLQFTISHDEAIDLLLAVIHDCVKTRDLGCIKPIDFITPKVLIDALKANRPIDVRKALSNNLLPLDYLNVFHLIKAAKHLKIPTPTFFYLTNKFSETHKDAVTSALQAPP